MLKKDERGKKWLAENHSPAPAFVSHGFNVGVIVVFSIQFYFRP